MRLVRNEAFVIDVNGMVSLISGSPSLQKAQELVQGYVEMRRFEQGGIEAQALFNEDGLLKQMPYNAAASELVGCQLVGPVVVLTGRRRWS